MNALLNAPHRNGLARPAHLVISYGLLIVLGAVMATSILGCGGSKKSTSTTSSGFTKKIQVYTNPQDSVIATVRNDNGQHVSFAGTKDSTGRTTQITSALIQSADGNKDHDAYVVFDEQHRPTSIQLLGGAYVQVEYASSNLINLTVVAGGTNHSGVIHFDPSTHTVLTKGQAIAREVKAAMVKKSSGTASLKNRATAADIVVTCNQEPYGGIQPVVVFSPKNAPDLRLPVALSASTPVAGEYSYTLDHKPEKGSTTVSELANDLTEFVEPLCDAYDNSGIDLDEETIAALATASAVLGPEAPFVVEFALNAPKAICDTSNLLKGLQMLIDNVEALDLFQSGVVEATVIASNGFRNVESESKSAGLPHPRFNFDLRGAQCSGETAYVYDDGPDYDDVFSVSVDGQALGSTPQGGGANFPLTNLTSGTHTLTITCDVDGTQGGGGFNVTLADGFQFSDGSSSAQGVVDQGQSESLTFTAGGSKSVRSTSVFQIPSRSIKPMGSRP